MSSLAPSHASNNPVAAGFSLEFAGSLQSYVAERLLPTFRIGPEATRYLVHDPRQNFGQSTLRSKRAHLTHSKPVRTSFTEAAVLCEASARHYDWDDRSLSNAPPGYDVIRAGARVISRQLAIERELDTFALFNAVAAAIDLEGGTNTQWNESASDGIGNIRTLKTSIELEVGSLVDEEARLVMFAGATVDDYLKSGDRTTGTVGEDIHERTKFTQRVTGGTLTDNMIADYFGVPEYVPMRGVHDGANPGQTQANAHIWGDIVILAMVSPTPEPRTVTTGWTFATKSLTDESGEGWMQWAEPNIGHGGQRLEGEHIIAPKLVSTSAFRVLKDVLA